MEQNKKIQSQFTKTIFILFGIYLIFLIIDSLYRFFSQPYPQLKSFSILVIIICILLFILIYFAFKKINDKIKLNISLLIFSTGISLLGIEVFLDLKKDTRSKIRVLNDLKKEGKIAYPNVHPYSLLENESTRDGLYYQNKKIFPLSGISNKLMVQSNENGYWMMYKGDKYGFHNDREIYNNNIDVMLIGDSFAEGWSVRSHENIGGVLLKKGLNIANFGKSGNGPLLELATIKEYAKPLKPKIVLWLYYINDLENLNNEIKSKILIKYLNNDNFNQELITKQKEIDNVLINYIDILWKEKIDNYKPKTTEIIVRVIKIFRFNHIRKIINFRPNNDKIKSSNLVETSIFKNILRASNQIVSSWEGKLYFVYLPSHTRYASGQIDPNRSTVFKIVNDLKIPIIDTDEDVFSVHPDPLSLFPFRKFGHYNSKGYYLVGNAIFNRLQKDGF